MCSGLLCEANSELLLGRSDRILRGLGDAELDDGLGLNLDGLAGLGVAADAGLSLCLYELAESRNGELAVLLGLLDSGLCEGLEEGCGLLVGELELLRHRADELCLGHAFCHMRELLLKRFLRAIVSTHRINDIRRGPRNPPCRFLHRTESSVFMRVRRTAP